MQRIQKKNKKRVNVMILGVGTDLVEIDRMRKACEKEHFVSRTFTEAESRQAGGSASKLAGSFAVKEACPVRRPPASCMRGSPSALPPGRSSAMCFS